MKTIAAALAVIAAIVLIHWMQTSHTQAMEACQVKHSYDTCAYALR